LPALTGRLDSSTFMIVDPPRAGIEKQALDAIINIKPQLIAYVSCDPATLARDAARLIHGGYRLLEVTPFDLFPQTYHIESISIFENM
jgi:23S rRNA (uracil1939-C5)-methyltransferase